MDTQQTPINRNVPPRGRRSRVAERVSSWFDEWVLIRGGDRLGALLELLRRYLEAAAWPLRRYLLWPLQDRFAALGAPARTLAAVGAALLLAVGVGAALSAGSGDDSGPAPVEVAVATDEPPVVPPARPSEPEVTAEPVETLRGEAPVFGSKKQKKARADLDPAESIGAEPQAGAPPGSDPATTRIGSEPGAASASRAGPAAGQSAVGIDGPPAGPRAIAVAEDFADAFVLYETGGDKKKVRRAFVATTTPELRKALLKRPPRQPANVEVPKARVVNVVAGPSHGGVYAVSVSLLRVGVTSELRLDMEKHKDEWLVTNVLG